MTFDNIQLTIIGIYVFSCGVCIGYLLSTEVNGNKTNKSFWQELFCSFVPLVNTGAAFCLIFVAIVDSFELHIKKKHDESDSIEW